MTGALATADARRGGPVPASAFLDQLVMVLRAEDAWGAWERMGDAELLAGFILTPEERREVPVTGEPEPEQVWRLEQFYAAVGLLVGRRTGCAAAPMSRIHWEGFGRVVLIAGRLVVLSRHLRDVHRFGFASFTELAAEGERLATEAAALIAEHPELARAG
ncbi:MAG: NifX-associated nitrogen fixation protein [Alphaproteobacteria bacterium]